MAYGTPTDPVAGTVITVAYAITNILDPIRALRANSGAGDPGALNRVALSTGVGGPTSWQQVPTDAILDGAVTDAKLATQKVDAATSPVANFAALRGANLNGMFEVVSTATDGPASGQFYYCVNVVEATNPSTNVCQIAVNIADQNDVAIRTVVSGVAGPWRRLWHAGNGGPGTGLDADLLDGNDSAAFALLASAPTFTGNVSAPRLVSTVAPGTAPFSVTSTTQVNNLNAAQVAGKTPTATPTANALPLADATGKLDAWVSAAAVYTPRTGTIRAWAGQPSQLAAELASDGGWLECDGSVVSQTTYAALFTKIGTIWNTSGEGAGNFRLPDFRDRSFVGKSSTRATGATGGASTQSVQHQHAASGLSVTPGDSDDNHDMGGTGSGTNVARASHHHGTVGVSGTVDNGGTTSLSMYHPYGTTYMLIKT